MYKIEKGIPLPPANTVAQTKYPWAEMEVGDSFFVEGKTVEQMGSVAANARKRTGRRFATRKVEGGTRVWRTE